MEYQFIKKLPTPEEYNFLREKVGWGIYNIQILKNSLPNSIFSVCVYLQDKIIGMGRVIGDNGLCFYIQDVIVLPEYQNQGIGNQIMKEIMEYIQEHSNNNSCIGLMSAYGREAFYEKYGFIKDRQRN